MRIVVKGCTGFIGKALAKRLLQEKHSVVTLDYQEGYKTEEIRRF